MWTYNDEIIDTPIDGMDSFVYLIERLNVEEDKESPIFYIGKKVFFNKGKHKCKNYIKESNWWTYYGSSDWLTADVEKYGKECFRRKILHICRTRGDAGYLEALEQMQRNVLGIDESGYKLYYNKNILGRYRTDPEFYKLQQPISDYMNLDSVHSPNKNKVRINNGEENRFMTPKQAKLLVDTSNWNYGWCEKHYKVNDGVTNLFIPKSQITQQHTYGWLQTWVNDGVNEFKVNLKDADKYDIGRVFVVKYKNKISLFKDDQYKWVNDYDVEAQLKKGWIKKGDIEHFNVFFVTDEIKQKHFRTEEEQLTFLKNNPSWRKGQFFRKNLTTKDKVIAKDMITGEKVIVTPEVYANSPNLTTMRTKKVKIKQGRKIIFKGYLKQFLNEHPNYSIAPFSRGLQSSDGLVYVSRGKDKFINEYKYIITWI